MKTVLLFFACLLAGVVQVQAQTIKGRLTDTTGQPVAYANVILQTSDSTFVDGTNTNDEGKFAVMAPGSGDYLLQLSFIGYETQLVSLPGLDKDMDLGTLVLDESTQMLDEATVTASATVRKIDRQIVYPSATQRSLSSGGYDLLARMMLPNLKVDPVNNQISTVSNGQVEVRINGVVASSGQLMALQPEEVLRVEYVDNPGMRYSDTQVEAVVNYIVKRRDSGFSGGLSALNAVATGFGNDNLYLMFNKGKSQFSVNYYMTYRDYDDRYVEGFERYTLPDGTTRQRDQLPVSAPFGYTTHTVQATYNLTSPDKYALNIQFTDDYYHTGKQDFRQRLVEQGHADLYTFTHRTDRNNSPSLDIYYEQQLPGQQSLTANLVGTYIGTDFTYDYRTYETPGTDLSRYAYGTEGDRYSLIGEAIYGKSWKKVRLNVGMKGNKAYTRNVYTGDGGKTLRLHNSSIYGYAELLGRLGKLDYRIGAGVQRQAFSESDVSYRYVTFRPTLSLAYPVFGGAQLRYSFSVSPYTPSLSALSDVLQQKNDLQASRGNRNLEPYRSYDNRLTFAWGNSRLSAYLEGWYTYYDNPIMTTINPVQNEAGGYVLEFSSDNGDSHRQAGGMLSLQWKIIPEHLSIGAYGGVSYYHSVGEGLDNEYTAWNGGVSLDANYKNFGLYITAATRPRSLYGYHVNYGEKNAVVQLSYKHKSLLVGAFCLYPFMPGGWTGGSRITGSRFIESRNWTHIEDNGNMFCLFLRWDFSVGRQSQAKSKTLQNKDTDSGIAK